VLLRGGRVCVLIALAIWLLARLWPADPVFPFDDSYITAHNVDVLGGADPSFPGTSALTGATSLVHLAATWLVALTMPTLRALLAVAFAGAALYVWGVLRLTAGLAGRWRELVVFAGLASGLVMYQAFNGLETGLALAGGSWLLVAHRERRPGLLGVLTGLALYIRPELALFAGALAFDLLRTGDRRARRTLLTTAFAAAAPWALWGLVEVGTALPGTIAAKRDWFAETRAPMGWRLDALGLGLGRFALAIGPLLGGIFWLARRTSTRLVVLAAGVMVVGYGVLLPGGLGHYAGRYLYVLVPLAVAGLAEGVRRHTRPARSVAAAAAAFALLTLPFHVVGIVSGREWTSAYLVPVGEWITGNVGDGEVVLVHDVGYPAFATRALIVDIVGLKTPWAAGVHHRLTEPSGGLLRANAIAEIAERADPAWLVVLESWDRIYRITDAFRLSGWGLDRQPCCRRYAIYHLSRPPTA
jgi:hypothetical protein